MTKNGTKEDKNQMPEMSSLEEISRVMKARIPEIVGYAYEVGVRKHSFVDVQQYVTSFADEIKHEVLRPIQKKNKSLEEYSNGLVAKSKKLSDVEASTVKQLVINHGKNNIQKFALVEKITLNKLTMIETNKQRSDDEIYRFRVEQKFGKAPESMNYFDRNPKAVFSISAIAEMPMSYDILKDLGMMPMVALATAFVLSVILAASGSEFAKVLAHRANVEVEEEIIYA